MSLTKGSVVLSPRSSGYECEKITRIARTSRRKSKLLARPGFTFSVTVWLMNCLASFFLDT